MDYTDPDVRCPQMAVKLNHSLLQLANKEDGISGTSTWHKTELHLANVYHLVQGWVSDSLKPVYDKTHHRLS